MKLNQDFVTLVSLQEGWSTEQRREYGLLEQEQALKYLTHSTGRDYGYSLIKWSMYYLVQKKDMIGIRVIMGSFTGENRRYLQSVTDFLDAISQTENRVRKL